MSWLVYLHHHSEAAADRILSDQKQGFCQASSSPCVLNACDCQPLPMLQLSPCHRARADGARQLESRSKVLGICFAVAAPWEAYFTCMVTSIARLQVVTELNEAANPVQRLSYQTTEHSQEQQQLAAEQLAPSAACLTVSSTGRWAAVASGRHVHIFDLADMSYHGRTAALQV